MIAIPATPAPAPMPAFAPTERLGPAGCTGYCSANTMFTIAEVGFSVVVVVEEDSMVVLTGVGGTDITDDEVTGTAGGTR